MRRADLGRSQSNTRPFRRGRSARSTYLRPYLALAGERQSRHRPTACRRGRPPVTRRPPNSVDYEEEGPQKCPLLPGGCAECHGRSWDFSRQRWIQWRRRPSHGVGQCKESSWRNSSKKPHTIERETSHVPCEQGLTEAVRLLLGLSGEVSSMTSPGSVNHRGTPPVPSLGAIWQFKRTVGPVLVSVLAQVLARRRGVSFGKQCDGLYRNNANKFPWGAADEAYRRNRGDPYPNLPAVLDRICAMWAPLERSRPMLTMSGRPGLRNARDSQQPVPRPEEERAVCRRHGVDSALDLKPVLGNRLPTGLGKDSGAPVDSEEV